MRVRDYAFVRSFSRCCALGLVRLLIQQPARGLRLRRRSKWMQERELLPAPSRLVTAGEQSNELCPTAAGIGIDGCGDARPSARPPAFAIRAAAAAGDPPRAFLKALHGKGSRGGGGDATGSSNRL